MILASPSNLIVVKSCAVEKTIEKMMSRPILDFRPLEKTPAPPFLYISIICGKKDASFFPHIEYFTTEWAFVSTATVVPVAIPEHRDDRKALFVFDAKKCLYLSRNVK